MYIINFHFVNLLFRPDWELVTKVSGKTLHNLFYDNLPPGFLGVKYRVGNREHFYSILICCPMNLDYWRRYDYNLADFGEGLHTCSKKVKKGILMLIITHLI